MYVENGMSEEFYLNEIMKTLKEILIEMRKNVHTIIKDTEILLTPDEWLRTEAYKDLTILDPDGWDRTNFEEDWIKPITVEEFNKRIIISTIICKNFYVEK